MKLTLKQKQQQMLNEINLDIAIKVYAIREIIINCYNRSELNEIQTDVNILTMKKREIEVGILPPY